MSLYAFGKVLCPASIAQSVAAALVHIGQQHGASIVSTAVEEDDVSALDEAIGSIADGVTFVLRSAPDDSDATVLWLEASDLAHAELVAASLDVYRIRQDVTLLPPTIVDLIRNTRLGRLCHAITTLQHSTTGALALVDGAHDDVFEGPPEACLDAMLRSFVRPWDWPPSRLYVWRV